MSSNYGLGFQGKGRIGIILKPFLKGSNRQQRRGKCMFNRQFIFSISFPLTINGTHNILGRHPDVKGDPEEKIQGARRKKIDIPDLLPYSHLMPASAPNWTRQGGTLFNEAYYIEYWRNQSLSLHKNVLLTKLKTKTIEKSQSWAKNAKIRRAE